MGENSAVAAVDSVPLDLPHVAAFGAMRVAEDIDRLDALWSRLSRDSRILLLNAAGIGYPDPGARWADLSEVIRKKVRNALETRLTLMASIGTDYLTSGKL